MRKRFAGLASACWRCAGIVANIVSSFYPSIYYVFLCQPVVRWTYLTGITLFGCATLMLSLLNRFQTIKWRATRATCFAILGCLGVVPWGHVIVTKAYHGKVGTALLLDLLMGASYLTGAVFYATRVPERWFPGKFDLLFHSHQIFHVFVVIGAYVHFLGALELVKWRDASGGCAIEVNSSAAMNISEQGDAYDMDDLLCFFESSFQTLWQE
jgi:adiponectin receptor